MSTAPPHSPARGAEGIVVLFEEVVQSPERVIGDGGKFLRILVQGTEAQSLETLS